MLQIPLPPDTEQTLRERARASGEDVASYVTRLIQQAPFARQSTNYSPLSASRSTRAALPMTISTDSGKSCGMRFGRKSKHGKPRPREHAGRLRLHALLSGEL